MFATEPTTESPLFELDSVVVTPHLGATTREAQDKAGDTIADMVQLALAGEFVPFAVNVERRRGQRDAAPVPAARRAARPAVRLARRRGRRARSRCCFEGDIAGYDTRILTLAVLKGFFGGISDEPVTYVNAPQLAKDHGVEVREVNCTTSDDYVNLITLSRRRSLDQRHVGRPARRAAHRR